MKGTKSMKKLEINKENCDQFCVQSLFTSYEGGNHVDHTFLFVDIWLELQEIGSYTD